MGIPGYFSRYSIKFPNTIIKKKIELIDALFLDFNCAIHPCCRKFAKEHYSQSRKDICEKHMIDECLSHLIKLIKYSSPTRLVYLAIDGVAPRAKMVQQRNRRFKSIKEKQLDNEILKKCSNSNSNQNPNSNSNQNPNSNIQKEKQEEDNKENEECELWDTNSISPGTVFMAKLSDALKKYFKECNEPYLEQLTIIISDSNEPGEGEHKILEYIKTHQHQITPKYNIAIYGLDADLIMLSMVSHINRIYLLRESVEFGAEYFNDGTTFCYLDIDLFKYSIMTDLTEKIPHKMKIDDQLLLVDDYIFLCFMIGNDFLPNLPPLNIKDSGLDLLTDIYTNIFTTRIKTIKKYEWVRDKSIYTGDANGSELEGGWRTDRSNFTPIIKLEFLIDTEKCQINHSYLTEIFEKLSVAEDELMRNLETKREFLRPSSNRNNKNSSNSQKSQPQSQYEILKDELHNYPILHKKDEMKIDIRNPDKNWQIRYYKQCFHFEPTKENIEDVCYKYIQGLQWTLTYYYKGCSSWDWYYPHHHNPTVQDLYKFISDDSNWKKVRLIKSPPFRPFEQLMFILPPESKHLLPESYQILMNTNSPIIHFYPENYKFDTIYKRFFWQCPPILPPVNAQLLKKSLMKKQLTREEQSRDSITQPEIIKKSKSNLH